MTLQGTTLTWWSITPIGVTAAAPAAAWAPGPSTLDLFRQEEEDRKAAEKIVREWNQRIRPRPPSGYVCHICFNVGHYIQDCVRGSSRDQSRTPYQGPRTSYGAFMCKKCKRKWISSSSMANTSQKCIKCHIDTYPHKQWRDDRFRYPRNQMYTPHSLVK